MIVLISLGPSPGGGDSLTPKLSHLFSRFIWDQKMVSLH